jgi:hypothetical protein
LAIKNPNQDLPVIFSEAMEGAADDIPGLACDRDLLWVWAIVGEPLYRQPAAPPAAHPVLDLRGNLSVGHGLGESKDALRIAQTAALNGLINRQKQVLNDVVTILGFEFATKARAETRLERVV